MKRKDKPRVAWGVTGSGHYLKECMALIRQRDDVDLFMSKAAAEVMAMYDFDTRASRRFYLKRQVMIVNSLHAV